MAFLGIRINHETGRLLSQIEVPGDKTHASELHITLLHFSDNWPISEISKSLDATYQVVSQTHPFLITMEKVTHFPRCHNEKCAVIAKVESPELHKLRKSLADNFDKAGIKFSKDFKEFKPHVTLSYAEEEPKDFKFSPVEMIVQEIVLWGGDCGDDRLFVTFPLAGPKVVKNAMLLEKVQIFSKIANNPPQAYLTQTTERRKIDRQDRL